MSLQKEILFNTDVIAINQQVTAQGRPVVNDDLSVWSRMLAGGDVAVALYNQEDDSQNIGFHVDQVGFDMAEKICARDLWKHVDVSSFIVNGVFTNQTILAHETMVVRLSKC